MISYLMQRFAFLCTSILFLVMKFLCQCDNNDSEKIYVIVMITFSETDK